MTEGFMGDDYANLHRTIGELPKASVASEREVKWIDDEHLIGVSRDQQGRLEIFLAGPMLDCNLALVSSHVAHDKWLTHNEKVVEANRIMLPNEQHFDAVAAFLCAHLIENNFYKDRQGGFGRSEPVIAMALDPTRLQGESLVGLVGELLIMRALLDRDPNLTKKIVSSWFGFGRSSRDFQLGALGVEVKTTRGSSSTHRIQGVHQVELGHPVGGGLETVLYLVSVGIEEAEGPDSQQNSWSLPSLVERLLNQIETACSSAVEAKSLQSLLLTSIKEYGSGSGLGYDHSHMKHQVLFGTRWRTAFVRAYDMTDPAISVPRTTDLAQYSMVIPTTVEFSISFPNQIRGDVNPIGGLTTVADALLDRARRALPED